MIHMWAIETLKKISTRKGTSVLLINFAFFIENDWTKSLFSFLLLNVSILLLSVAL